MPETSSSPLSAIYDDAYHAARLDESGRSAAVVVPLLIGLFPWVTSVVDVGCGSGTWLHQFQLHGIPKVLGLDGAEVSPQLLQIDRAFVRQVDLCEPLPPIGRFDLAVSLDVADCLPAAAAAPFVDALTASSDLIVFSAAVPGQSLQPTLNERWPSYWIALFAAYRFTCFDVLRARLWYDQRVNWCYSQNILVFASESRTDISAQLSSLSRSGPVDIIHPRAFEAFRGEAPHESGSTLMLYPYRLVEEGYRGYNILQIDVDKFLALGQGEGGYSPQKLVASGYKFA
jgi:SAM-dependent methyltransferase